MSKRVLLIGGNFYPELTGIGKYNGEMIDKLASLGYHCTVVTSFPYYPHWKVEVPYTKSSRWFKKELKTSPGNASGSIEIFRCPHYIPKKPTGLKRVISDFSFSFAAFLKIFQLLFWKKYDFVLVVAPPFQLGLLGILYKKVKGAKFFYHIQDLQIDAARDFELIRSEFLIGLLFKVEKFILKKADIVSSISQGMIKKIEMKHPREVFFFPNWVDTLLFFPIPGKEMLKREFGFETTDKIILYSGAIGEKQGLEAILESAKALENYPDLKFVICGSGPYKEKLEEIKQNSNLENVIFFPLQPLEKLNFFLNMADVHLVLQKANATDLVMPSKLSAILSVGGTAIITAHEGSSLYEVVADHQMGILIRPEEPASLILAIEQALKSKDQTVGKNARLYAEQYLSIDGIFRKYIVHLQ
ncbi:MAG: WcaI family glycosyltransferase [Ferruginibacter sp.]|nr:WcaI family glycosyltransferase [Ferruginibacter sp.]